MTKEELRGMLKQQEADELVFKGKCHDCGKEIEVAARIDDESAVAEGGSVYKVEPPSVSEDNIFLKCEECFKQDNGLKKWRKTEVYSRVVGYLRPVEQWNKGKKTEWSMRKVYKIK